MKIFLLLPFIFFSSAVHAGPKDDFSKQIECDWETASFQEASQNSKGKISIDPSGRYCLHPSGQIQQHDDYRVKRGRLNKTTKYSDVYRHSQTNRILKTDWYVIDWAIEENKLYRYKCEGNSDPEDFNCYGSTERELEGIALESLSSNNYYQIGNHFMKIGSETKSDYKLAISNYINAIKLNQTHFNALDELAYVYGDLKKDYQSAITILNQLIKINPTEEEVNQYITKYPIVVSTTSNDYREIKIFQKSEDLKSLIINANVSIAWFRYLSKDYKGAINDVNNFLKNNPNVPNDSKGFVLDTRGLAKHRIGNNNKEACSDLKEAALLLEEYNIGNTKDYLASEGGAWCRNMVN